MSLCCAASGATASWAAHRHPRPCPVAARKPAPRASAPPRARRSLSPSHATTAIGRHSPTAPATPTAFASHTTAHRHRRARPPSARRRRPPARTTPRPFACHISALRHRSARPQHADAADRLRLPHRGRARATPPHLAIAVRSHRRSLLRPPHTFRTPPQPPNDQVHRRGATAPDNQQTSVAPRPVQPLVGRRAAPACRPHRAHASSSKYSSVFS
jgi:hypothetical protein